MCMTCVGHVYDMCMTCVWHVYDMWMTCEWHVNDMCMPCGMCMLYGIIMPCVAHAYKPWHLNTGMLQMSKRTKASSWGERNDTRHAHDTRTAHAEQPASNATLRPSRMRMHGVLFDHLTRAWFPNPDGWALRDMAPTVTWTIGSRKMTGFGQT